MSASINVHGVTGVRTTDTDPICGKPRLGIVFECGPEYEFNLTAFMADKESSAIVGAKILLACHSLIVQSSPVLAKEAS